MEALICNNLYGFGEMKAKLKPELLQPGMFDDMGRFMLGRSAALPGELGLKRDFSRNY